MSCRILVSQLGIKPMLPTPVFLGFPCGSVGKESACNAGDLGSIPGWEDPLKKGKATHSSILAWRIPCTVQSMGLQSQTRLSNSHFHFHFHSCSGSTVLTSGPPGKSLSEPFFPLVQPQFFWRWYYFWFWWIQHNEQLVRSSLQTLKAAIKMAVRQIHTGAQPEVTH